VFNALPPARLVGILSTVLRDSADWDRPLDPFQASQLKSASSIGRFAAAEIAHAGPVLEGFRAALREVAPDAPADLPELGAYLCDLMATLPPGDLMATLQCLLRDLCAAEIDILTSAAKRADS
jgi:hypothetical protein